MLKIDFNARAKKALHNGTAITTLLLPAEYGQSMDFTQCAMSQQWNGKWRVDYYNCILKERVHKYPQHQFEPTTVQIETGHGIEEYQYIHIERVAKNLSLEDALDILKSDEDKSKSIDATQRYLKKAPQSPSATHFSKHS